ncbi:MAG: O-methyltransferase [Ferruginibacter sp.]
MYTTPTLALKFIRYWLTAQNGKGHGVHSPFIFDFIVRVLNHNRSDSDGEALEKIRKKLLQDNRLLEVEDWGAGSRTHHTNQRRVSSIAGSSLKPPKYARLLGNMVRYYQPTTILELGTSLGITTSYMAKASPNARVITLEGSEAIADVAREVFSQTNAANVELQVGSFDKTLPEVLKLNPRIDLAFLDGNHRMQPTLDYVNLLKPHLQQHSILIIDDIHWSAEMELAWDRLKADPAVTASVDLFFVGILFFSPAFKAKQHFSIRY